MLNQKLLEVLGTPPDAAVAIVTHGRDGAHVVNSWNSYAQVSGEDQLLFPAGRMHQTERNIREDNRVKLTVTNREVQGKAYKGTGFLLTGTAEWIEAGPTFELIKAKFPWARAALSITIASAEQTL